MNVLHVPQALLVRDDALAVRWLAQSPELPLEHRAALEQIVVAFGPRPIGIRCPEAFLILPEPQGRVYLVRVADLGPTADPPVALGFHFLILTRSDYEETNAEAFEILRAQPALWERRGDLPLAALPRSLQLRSLGEVEAVLRQPEGPLLLGSTQALLDGSRLAFRRDLPANESFAGLWKLIPYRSAVELRLATFAFSNALSWNILAGPALDPNEYDYRYLSEPQAENYPEGRYELSLQIAVEAGDEAAMRRLLLRRTRKDTLRMALWLLTGMMLASLVFGLVRAFR